MGRPPKETHSDSIQGPLEFGPKSNEHNKIINTVHLLMKESFPLRTLPHFIHIFCFKLHKTPEKEKGFIWDKHNQSASSLRSRWRSSKSLTWLAFRAPCFLGSGIASHLGTEERIWGHAVRALGTGPAEPFRPKLPHL